MSINTSSPIDILQSIMDQCCDQHDLCFGCRHTISCCNLWDKISEQLISRPLSMEQLRNYLNEFNDMWQKGSTDIIDNEELIDLTILAFANHGDS
jgi:hypothetical protein